MMPKYQHPTENKHIFGDAEYVVNEVKTAGGDRYKVCSILLTKEEIDTLKQKITNPPADDEEAGERG